MAGGHTETLQDLFDVGALDETNNRRIRLAASLPVGGRKCLLQKQVSPLKSPCFVDSRIE